MSAKVKCLRIFSWKQFIGCGVCVFSACLLVSFPVRADQLGVVINSPAYIYQGADFDSKVVAELSPGKKIPISSRKWGAFFKTPIPAGGVGYVSDGDVKPIRGSAGSSVSSGRSAGGGKQKPGSKSANDAAKSEPERPRDPWWISKMLGVELAEIQYSELVSKIQYAESELDYGLKYSFPFRPLDNTHMDINVLGHFAAPGFYSGLSSTAPSGYYVTLDAPVMWTMGNFWRKDGATYFGLGPMLNISNYSVTLNGTPTAVQAVRFGAVFDFGLAFKLSSSLILKFDPRYYIETQSYWAALLSLQIIL